MTYAQVSWVSSLLGGFYLLAGKGGDYYFLMVVLEGLLECQFYFICQVVANLGRNYPCGITASAITCFTASGEFSVTVMSPICYVPTIMISAHFLGIVR